MTGVPWTDLTHGGLDTQSPSCEADESGSLKTGYRQIALILFWEHLEEEALLLFAPCSLFKALLSHVVCILNFSHLQSSRSHSTQEVFISSLSTEPLGGHMWLLTSSEKDHKLACACEEAGAGHGAWLSPLLTADIELMLFLAWGRAITQEFLLKWFFVKPPLTPTTSPLLSFPPFSFWARHLELLYWGYCHAAGLRLHWIWWNEEKWMKKNTCWIRGLSDFLSWIKCHLNKMFVSWTLSVQDIVCSEPSLLFQSQLHQSSDACPASHGTTLVFHCILAFCHWPLPSAS